MQLLFPHIKVNSGAGWKLLQKRIEMVESHHRGACPRLNSVAGLLWPIVLDVAPSA